MTTPPPGRAGPVAPAADLLADAARYRKGTYDRWRDRCARLDPHFAAVWSRYTGEVYARPALDTRTRLLVLAGEYTVLGNGSGLADTFQAAIRLRVDLKEVLEAVLQCWVYAGEQRVSDAVDVFVEVVDAANLLDDVAARGLSADATTVGRSLAVERAAWHPDDVDDPRLAGLLERHGWTGISTGLRLRPGNHVNVLAQLDALDVEFAGLWVRAIYEGMYTRGVLDDLTRTLCMVGDCLAAAETENSPQHMRGALRQGASPAALLDLVLLSSTVVGIPHVIDVALDHLWQILDDLGRRTELRSRSW